MTLPAELHRPIMAAVDARTADREPFLARLVQTRSSNPPGDCAPIAVLRAELWKSSGSKSTFTRGRASWP